jgi:hypothetical protein
MASNRISTALSVLMTRNFSKMLLRARRALEFSHGLGHGEKNSARAFLVGSTSVSGPAGDGVDGLLSAQQQNIRLSLAADRNHRLVGPLAIDVPELLEVRSVKIIELLTGIDEHGLELI